jgi:hypothetical protein
MPVMIHAGDEPDPAKDEWDARHHGHNRAYQASGNQRRGNDVQQGVHGQVYLLGAPTVIRGSSRGPLPTIRPPRLSNSVNEM